MVAWLPYSLEGGDVAALRLLSPAPGQAKPIPLIELSRELVGNDPHFVYGFGGVGNAGGRSDSYRPKSQAAGGRFKLCKVGQPDDETIKGGFSGAPVWNETQKCVIGMVATAAVVNKDDQQSIAYAIPTKELRPVLKRIEAFCLHDVLMHCLECCDREDQRHQLQIAIDATFRHCNPQGGDRTWREQLVDLAVDRPPASGWENEGRLIHFAMMLGLDNIPIQAYDQIKAWVEQSAHGYKFSDLLERLTREMKQRSTPSSNLCQHLMVVVEPKETAPNYFRVSLWPVSDRATYNPQKPPSRITSDQPLSLSELPCFIRQQIRGKFRKHPTPMIHLFVPRSLFHWDLEMLPSSSVGILGSEYPFVIRTNLKTHPIGYYYYDEWNEKWAQIEDAFTEKTADVFHLVDCSLPTRELVDNLLSIKAAILKEFDHVGDLFDVISAETALPIALWSRDPQFQDQLPDIFDCIVETLHNRIRQERERAFRSPSEKLLGHHLSLVWEDPKIVPPDMQFDPEAC